MTNKTIRVLIACLTLTALICFTPGCGIHQDPAQPVTYYQLNYPPPEVAFQADRLPFVIRVEPFQPSELYSRQGLVYQKGKYLSARYAYHQWITPLERMIPRFIARDLRHADIVRSVFLNGGEAATHRVVGSIEAFYEEDREDQWTAVVSISITLIDTGTRPIVEQICFQKLYNSRKICQEKTPGAFVAAASQAMSDVSRKLTADIYEILVKTAPSDRPE